MKYIRFIKKPSLDMYPGIKVTKKTKFKYENKHVRQEVRNLVLHSITKVVGEGFKSTYDTTIKLQEGDVLLFESEQRGYIKPVEDFVTIAEAADELNCIREV